MLKFKKVYTIKVISIIVVALFTVTSNVHIDTISRNSKAQIRKQMDFSNEKEMIPRYLCSMLAFAISSGILRSRSTMEIEPLDLDDELVQDIEKNNIGVEIDAGGNLWVFHEDNKVYIVVDKRGLMELRERKDFEIAFGDSTGRNTKIVSGTRRKKIKKALAIALIVATLAVQKPLIAQANGQGPKLTTMQRLLLAGLVAGGSFYMAEQNPDLRKVLAFDVLGMGSVPAVAALLRGEPAFDPWLQGMTAGLTMYTGKQILADHVETPGIGFLAKGIHSLGTSMHYNLTLGKDALWRYEVDFGPLLLGFERDEDGKRYTKLNLLPGPIIAPLALGLVGGYNDIEFDGKTTLKTGALSFLANSSLRGTTFCNVIVRDSTDPMDSTSVHEAIHALQYSEFAFLGIPIETLGRAEFPYKGKLFEWFRFDRDYSKGLISSLAYLVWSGEDPRSRISELEPYSWDAYVSSRQSGGISRGPLLLSHGILLPGAGFLIQIIPHNQSLIKSLLIEAQQEIKRKEIEDVGSFLLRLKQTKKGI